jgi:cell shape-determining protein MreC
MRSGKPFIILAILLFLGAGLFLRKQFQVTLGTTGGHIGSVLSSPFAFLANIGALPSLKANFDALTLENAELKGKLALFEDLSELPHTDRAVEAHVFSTYPFNHRNMLMIDKGEDAGLGVGWGVIMGDSLLLGKVAAVFPYTSSVQTIFDPDMTLPVKIGEVGVNALLVGGRIPRLTLIDKGVVIVPGDTVYSSGNNFPYGITVGSVGVLVPASGAAFQEATLEIAYDAGTVDRVSVLIP